MRTLAMPFPAFKRGGIVGVRVTSISGTCAITLFGQNPAHSAAERRGERVKLSLDEIGDAPVAVRVRVKTIGL